LLLLFFLN